MKNYLDINGLKTLLTQIKDVGIGGKKLSTEDFTTELKNKLVSLTNIDNTELSNKINQLQLRLDTLIGNGNTTNVIDTFNEIETFLQGVTNNDTLTGLLYDLKNELLVDISISGNGNAVTNITIKDNNILVTKGSTFLTGITKILVENVLTGNITSHTHNQYLTGITKSQVEDVLTGNVVTHTHALYITSHLSLSNYVTLDSDQTISGVKTFNSGSLKISGGKSTLFIKGDGTLDGNTYLTGITKTLVENVLTGNIDSHTHNYLSSITKALVEAVLTGQITTHTHNYLSAITKALVEGVLTGNITTHTHSLYLTSHQSLTNYITLDGTQTITGVKTFSGGLKLNAGTSWTDADRTIPFSAADDMSKLMYYNDNTSTGLTYNPHTGAIKATTFIKRGGTNKQFLKADGTVDSNSYLTGITKAQVEGVLTGLITSHTHNYLSVITKAQVEAVLTGNITTHTHSQYLTSHQSLTNYVTLDGALTITGVKTFNSGSLKISGGSSTLFIKADGTLDGSTYLTGITKTQVENVLTGNITTHTHSLYLTGITKAQVEGVLTGAITSHKHIGLSGWTDTRNTSTAPNDYNSTFKVVGIKTRTNTGITNSDSYITIAGLRGWNDKSGGNAWEFGFGNNDIYIRNGIDTSWNDWKMVACDDNANMATYFITSSSANTGWYKISINSSIAWMLYFKIRIYLSYLFYDIDFSGYNYGSSYWYQPMAKLVSSSTTTINVKFGYDGVGKLWVAIPVGLYSAIQITDVANGYNKITYIRNLFTITSQTTLTGTILKEYTLTTAADSVAWGNVTGKPSTYPPDTHTHSQYLTGITKALVEGVLTGNITTHTHSLYLTAHLSLANYVTLDGALTVSGIKTFSNGLKLNTATSWTSSDRSIPFSSPDDIGRILYYNTDSTTGFTYNPNTGAVKASSFIKRGGTSSQWLKADGTVDNMSTFARGGIAEYIATASTSGQWIRIAECSSYTSYATIDICNSYTHNPTTGIKLIFHNSFFSKPDLMKITSIGCSIIFTKARIIYPNANDGRKYYLEVFYNSTTANSVYLRMSNAYNCTLLQTFTIGEIPTNYSSKEFIFTDGVNTEKITASTIVKSGGTASLVLMADGTVQTHYKSATVTSATSDDGMITPKAMNDWTSKTFLKLAGGSMSNTNKVTNLNADLLDGLHVDDVKGIRVVHPQIEPVGVGVATPNVLGMLFGYPVYTDPEFASGTNSVSKYNNAGNNNVIVTRIEDNLSSGNSSGYILQIQNIGTASPNIGGFQQSITSRANAIFMQVFRAKIPVGYNVNTASNSMGTNYKDVWITDTAGTGKWEWYGRMVYCGNTGTFSTGGHVSFSGTAGTATAPVNFYLSHCQLYDLTKGNYSGLRSRYADTATNSTSATYSGYLNNNTTMVASASGLGWRSGAVTIGTAANTAIEGSSAAINQWSYPTGGTSTTTTIANIMNIRLGWDSKYWADIFTSPNAERLWYRLVSNGTAKAWKKLAFTDDNVSTATKLQTPRTLTIGSTGKTFDGTANVSWTLSEIGAAATSHTHSYLPLTGGTMSNTNTVTNLNADLLDGLHASSFMLNKTINCRDTSIYDLRYSYGSFDRNDYTTGAYYSLYPSGYGQYISLAHSSSNSAALIFIDSNFGGNDGHVYINTRKAGSTNTSFNEWRTIAYTTDNVASATSASTAVKLTNARTIWGLSFNGTANISGNMTSVANITMTGTITMNSGILSYDTTNNVFKSNKPIYSLGGLSLTYTNNASGSGFYKIKINSTAAWMLYFKVRIYQTYHYFDIDISGYQYGNSFWYLPLALLVSGSNNITVYFGHDSANNLWIGLPCGNYTGLTISNVVNGYNAVTNPDTLFTITKETTLTGTTDKTITLSKLDDTITNKFLTLHKGAEHVIPTTYSSLVTTRNNNELVPGKYYRILDYVTTVANDPEASSAGHPFDLIVLALTKNALAEEAYAIWSNRDTTGYFSKSNLPAWKVWYCLDNDYTKYGWANLSGYGVIYRLIDEWGNDCPYDFKNIRFKRYLINKTTEFTGKLPSTYRGIKNAGTQDISITSAAILAYTFTYAKDKDNYIDGSLIGLYAINYNENNYVGNNIIKSYADLCIIDNKSYNRYILNNIVFYSKFGYETFNAVNNNTIETGCYNMTLSGCNNHIYNSCYGIIFDEDVRHTTVMADCNDICITNDIHSDYQYDTALHNYIGLFCRNIIISGSNNLIKDESSFIKIHGENTEINKHCYNITIVKNQLNPYNIKVGNNCKFITIAGCNIEIEPICEYLDVVKDTDGPTCKVLSGVNGTPLLSIYISFMNEPTNVVQFCGKRVNRDCIIWLPYQSPMDAIATLRQCGK